MGRRVKVEMVLVVSICLRAKDCPKGATGGCVHSTQDLGRALLTPSIKNRYDGVVLQSDRGDVDSVALAVL